MKRGRFSFIEYMIAFAFLAIIGSYALRFIYREEIRAWERSLEPEKYFVTVPLFLFLLSVYWRRSVKEARASGQPVVRPWVWVLAAFGIALACAGILAL